MYRKMSCRFKGGQLLIEPIERENGSWSFFRSLVQLHNYFEKYRDKRNKANWK